MSVWQQMDYCVKYPCTYHRTIGADSPALELERGIHPAAKIENNLRFMYKYALELLAFRSQSSRMEFDRGKGSISLGRCGVDGHVSPDSAEEE